MATKWIPLSEPMGNDSSCCNLSELCEPFKRIAMDKCYRFRCPLMVEVDEKVEYAEPIISDFSCNKSPERLNDD